MFQKVNLIKIFIIIIFSGIFLLTITNSSVKEYLKKNLLEEFQIFLKEKILVYSTIKNQKKDIIRKGQQISELRKENKKLNYQLNFLKKKFNNGQLISKTKIKEIGKRKLNNIKIFNLESTNMDIYESEENFSGSFYIEKFKDKILINFSNGNMYYFDESNLNKKNLSVNFLSSNIKSFLNNVNEKNITSQIRDSEVIDGKLYLSYAKKIKDACYNTSIIYSDINLSYMNFKEFFSYPECVSTKNVVVGTGGRIEKISGNKILFSIGEQLNLFPAQDPNSMFGKIVSIDLDSRKFRIVTMGHKNPQGLVYSNFHNLIFSSEHQSKGGDEINLIKINKDKIFNYGWAISSYGDHYDYVSKKDRKKYPLYKSHKKHGFEEPLYYFNPAIAPSEIIIEYENDNEIKFLLSSLKAKSLFELTYNILEKKITIDKQIEIGKRIRDLFNTKNYILLALEQNSSIAILQKN